MVKTIVYNENKKRKNKGYARELTKIIFNEDFKDWFFLRNLEDENLTNENLFNKHIDNLITGKLTLNVIFLKVSEVEQLLNHIKEETGLKVFINSKFLVEIEGLA